MPALDKRDEKAYHINMKKNSSAFSYGLLLLFIFCGSLSADTTQVKIAFLSVDNMSMDPRYDYLEGIISGILLFDLATAEGMVVVDRSSLESVLKEQELILSDLTDEDKAVNVGKILGADYLLKGQYVFLGNEIMLTLALIEVGSARTLPFSGRGASENLIHGLSEQIILRLTGREVVLQSEQHERSIISLKDEKPGSIALHCNLIRAEIYLDDEFAGYTTGDTTVPYEINNLTPGKHKLRVHLAGFGIVKQPEMTFHDWQENIEVKPGKRHVIKTRIYHFSDSLYELKKLLMQDETCNSKDITGPLKKQHKLSFVDRKGDTINLIVNVELSFSGTQAVLDAVIEYNDKQYTLQNICDVNKKQDVSKKIAKVDVTFKIAYYSNNRCNITYTVFRNDISTGMWQDEK